MGPDESEVVSLLKEGDKAGTVHVAHGIADYATLCGLDPFENTFTPTREPVTCTACLGMIQTVIAVAPVRTLKLWCAKIRTVTDEGTRT